MGNKKKAMPTGKPMGKNGRIKPPAQGGKGAKKPQGGGY